MGTSGAVFDVRCDLGITPSFGGTCLYMFSRLSSLSHDIITVDFGLFCPCEFECEFDSSLGRSATAPSNDSAISDIDHLITHHKASRSGSVTSVAFVFHLEFTQEVQKFTRIHTLIRNRRLDTRPCLNRNHENAL